MFVASNPMGTPRPITIRRWPARPWPSSRSSCGCSARAHRVRCWRSMRTCARRASPGRGAQPLGVPHLLRAVVGQLERRRCCGPGRWRATPPLVRRSWRSSIPAISGSAAWPRRRSRRSAGEGADGVRAAAARRGPGDPPQAGAGRPVRRRIGPCSCSSCSMPVTCLRTTQQLRSPAGRSRWRRVSLTARRRADPGPRPGGSPRSCATPSRSPAGQGRRIAPEGRPRRRGCLPDRRGGRREPRATPTQQYRKAARRSRQATERLFYGGSLR